MFIEEGIQCSLSILTSGMWVESIDMVIDLPADHEKFIGANQKHSRGHVRVVTPLLSNISSLVKTLEIGTIC